MRIAVLIYGQYRELDIAVKSWTFREKYYCDFYFSLWDKTHMFSRDRKKNFEISVNEKIVKDLIPNAEVCILKESDYFDVNLENREKFNKPQRAIFHMKNCLKMVENSKINYDNIMLTRTDQFMTSPDNFGSFPKLCKHNIIYGLSEFKILKEENFIIDTFLFGQYYTMKKFIENIPIHNNSSLHKDLPDTAISLNIQIKLMENFDATIIRPNCREIPENELNHFTISAKCIEWGTNV